MKYLIKGIAFIVSLSIVLNGILGILAPKGGSGIYNLKEFYRLEDNTVDVLMLGSSLSFINIDPAVMWNEEGIAAYSLGGAVQPLWNSYYYLKEALKTQRPSLITLEIYGSQIEYQPDNSWVLNNVSAIKSPLNRFNAVRCSTAREQWFPMFLGFPYYHDRYSGLADSDYLAYRGQKDFEYYLGHGTYYKTAAYEKPNAAIEAEAAELSEKPLEYLIKIIELCKKENIKLLLFASPTVLYPTLKGYYQTVRDIAEEYGVDYVDFNYLYDAIGLDFEKDFADENHLNQYGCPKFSKYFCDYLKEHYYLENHRNDNKYVRWDNAGEFFYASMFDYKLSQEISLEIHLSSIVSGKYNHLADVIWVSGYETSEVKSILLKYGIPIDRGIYVYSDGGIKEAELINGKYTFDFGMDIYSCYEAGMDKGRIQLFSVDNQLAVVTFDYYTMKLIDSNLYDNKGMSIEKPIDIVWSWVGTGD